MDSILEIVLTYYDKYMKEWLHSNKKVEKNIKIYYEDYIKYKLKNGYIKFKNI